MFEKKAMRFMAVSSIHRIKKNCDELEKIMDHYKIYDVDVIYEKRNDIHDLIGSLENHMVIKNDDFDESSFAEFTSMAYDVFEKIKLLKYKVHHYAID